MSHADDPVFWLEDNAAERRAPAAAKASRPRVVMQVTWSLVAGGSETYAMTVASHLDPTRFTSLMCAIDQGGALEAEARQRGLSYFVMHRRPGIEWRLMWRTYRLCRAQRVDVLHTHHFNQLFYTALAAKLTGARLVHTEHSIECYKRRRLRVALRVLSRLCDHVTAIGDDGAAVLRTLVPPHKLRIIRAGVDVAAFNRISQAQARQGLGLPADVPVAVIVARLYPEKNHALLLSAFARVVAQFPQAMLLIAGDGTERDAINHVVAQLGLAAHVRMLGVRRDVERLLAASDLFVLSSDREGLPVAVLEAMAAARPVVATAVGDLPRVVQPGITGQLVPPHDPPVLAAAMSEIFRDRPRAMQMGARGRAVVEQHYGLDAMIAQNEALYRA
jgi:glycosyltransferase involved in cell wall biosynthesis